MSGDTFRQRYRRDGFAIVPGASTEAELDVVAQDITGIFRRRAEAIGLVPPAADTHDALSQIMDSLFKADRESYVSAARQTQYLASVHCLGLSSAILDILRDLGIAVPSQATRPVVHFMADALRIDGGYHKTPAHQDWRDTQGSLDGVTFWLPLYDVGLRDYPLEVVAGSHRLGLLPSVDDPFGHRITDGQVGDDAYRPLPMRRGDVVAFSGFLVHRTGAFGGARVRIAFSYRFNNAAEASYVERNYPFPYAYRAEGRLLRANYPTAADLSAFFPEEVSDAPV